MTHDARALTLRRELARKTIHLAVAAVPASYALGLPRPTLLAALVALLAVALLVESLRHAMPRVRAQFTRLTGGLLRAHEHERLTGATWMLASFVLLVWLAPPHVAIAAMWAVAVGDAAAAVVGRAWGRHRVGTSGKSLEGSVACAVATLLGAVALAGLSPAASVAAGAAAAIAEFPAGPGDDNVRVAASVAVAVLLAETFLAAL